MQDFDSIYSQYFAKVYRFSLSLCKNQEEAQEITQEAFFKALKNIDSFKGDCKIDTWLCKIAGNVFFNSKKRNKKTERYPIEVIESDESIEDRLDDKDTAHEIYKVLHKLKEPYKEVFYLRVFTELSFAQIGLLFDKTESWARVTYYRAKIMIKEELC